MSDLDQDDIVDSTDVDDTNQDAPEPTIDDYNRNKESLDKATSNYVLPWKEILKKYGVKTFAELETKLSQDKDNFITKESHELDKFLTKNEELSSNAEELLATAKALQSVPKYKDKTLQELLTISAKTLKVEEEHQASQDKLKKSRVSDWDSPSESSNYSKADLERLATTNPEWYAKAIDRIDKGKAKYAG